MITIKINYWDRVSYTHPRSEIIKTEELSAETEDALFELFYKKNHKLTYCNGCYYKFVNDEDQEKYIHWYKNLSHARSFDLHYPSNSIVD